MTHRILVLIALASVAHAGAADARRFHPDRSRRVQTGKASFYGHREAGRKTASGKPLRPDRMTAASRTLPLGTRAKVVNHDTGKSAEVLITDRGPYVDGRVIDVTPKAAEKLGMVEDGVADVAVKPISIPAPPPK